MRKQFLRRCASKEKRREKESPVTFSSLKKKTEAHEREKEFIESNKRRYKWGLSRKFFAIPLTLRLD